jgi:hypothetical protein
MEAQLSVPVFTFWGSPIFLISDVLGSTVKLGAAAGKTGN